MWQMFIYNKSKGLVYRYTSMNHCTTLWLNTQGLCNVVGVLKAHALTKHDACANCRAMNNGYCYDQCAYCYWQA